MAQEVQIAGATYSDVPSIEVPDSNGTYHSFVDTSDADATASEILAGATRYVNGSKIIGAISPSTPVNSTISSKDTVITVPRGYYTGSSTVQIANAEQSKIIANNIRSGVTILGIGGSTNVVNTGDANATRADIASGKTRYVGGEKITGTGSGGGGTTPAEKKQINFIDYDGTILHSYSAIEWASVTALPANPSHTGLTAQGWSWTKAQIDSQLTAQPDVDVWVGQMYITSSGDTEIDVRFADSARLSPILTICVNGTVTVDWGDNTTADTVTGTSLTTRKAVSHTYATTGTYTMVIHVMSGSFQFYGSSSYTLLRKNTKQAQNRGYTNCVENIRFGSGVTSIGNYALYNCQSLTSITIPSGVTSIGDNAFNGCQSLTSITIPSGVTSIGSSAFAYCYSLTSITIPSGVTSIGSSAFNNCYSLTSITTPSGVTSIGSSAFNGCYSLTSITTPSGVTSIDSGAFQNCYNLKSVTISSGVTSIGGNAFGSCQTLASITIPSSVTSIGSSAFSNCLTLASITIPSGVTSIGSSAFNGCYGIAEYHILPTSVPTLGTTAFNYIVSDCIIYVPSESLEAYQTATNWSTYASYMVGE